MNPPRWFRALCSRLFDPKCKCGSTRPSYIYDDNGWKSAWCVDCAGRR